MDADQVERHTVYDWPKQLGQWCMCGGYTCGDQTGVYCTHSPLFRVGKTVANGRVPDLLAAFDAMAQQRRQEVRDEIASRLPKPKRKRRTKAEMAAARAALESKRVEVRKTLPEWLQGREQDLEDFMSRVRED